jgi:hypothetical protein
MARFTAQAQVAPARLTSRVSCACFLTLSAHAYFTCLIGNSVSLFGTVPLAGGRYCNVSYAIDSSPATLSATPVVNNTNITVFGALLYTVRVTSVI